MPRTRLTRSAIDALPTPGKEIVHWDQALPGFGLKITPKGRKVFVVLYRAQGGGSPLRKYTIGPYRRITLHNARIEAQKVLAARLEGRDPATEKLEARRRLTADTVAEVVALYGRLHLSQRRSGPELIRVLQRNLIDHLGARSVHAISKRDIIDLVNAVVDRGSPVAANKTLKVVRSFFGWCVGRAILERSPWTTKTSQRPSTARLVLPLCSRSRRDRERARHRGDKPRQSGTRPLRYPFHPIRVRRRKAAAAQGAIELVGRLCEAD
jgi:hypothetical protein